MRQQDVGVVGRRQPHHVLLGHLAERLPVQRLEERDVHLLQDVLLDGPVQPLPHVVLGPDLGVCNNTNTIYSFFSWRLLSMKVVLWFPFGQNLCCCFWFLAFKETGSCRAHFQNNKKLVKLNRINFLCKIIYSEFKWFLSADLRLQLLNSN